MKMAKNRDNIILLLLIISVVGIFVWLLVGGVYLSYTMEWEAFIEQYHPAISAVAEVSCFSIMVYGVGRFVFCKDKEKQIVGVVIAVCGALGTTIIALGRMLL